MICEKLQLKPGMAYWILAAAGADWHTTWHLIIRKRGGRHHFCRTAKNGSGTREGLDVTILLQDYRDLNDQFIVLFLWGCSSTSDRKITIPICGGGS